MKKFSKEQLEVASAVLQELGSFLGTEQGARENVHDRALLDYRTGEALYMETAFCTAFSDYLRHMSETVSNEAK